MAGKGMMRMVRGAVWVSLAAWMPAYALDFVVDNKPNPQAENGYRVQNGDVISGHPIFTADGGWRFLSLDIGSTSGTARSVPMSTVVMGRMTKGAVTMVQYVVVASGGSDGNGWQGDPCSGEKIVKINKIRQRLDRCAAAQIESVRFGGKPTDALKIEFTESNAGGRFYQVGFYVAYEYMGLSYAAVTAKDGAFKLRLQAWMEKMLEAVVKAADYDKPANAYDAVPGFTSAVLQDSSSSMVQFNPAGHNIAVPLAKHL